MTDTERLATDRAYWDEVAPEGAEAFIDGAFTKWDRGRELSFNRPIWIESPAPWSVKKYLASRLFEVVLRPTAREEWDGTGLPPVGVECECLFNDGWAKVLVLSVNGYEAWVRRPRGSHIVSEGLGNKFRPIRTPEQRERQSVIEQAFSKLSEFHDADQVLGDLYDAGMLHKQED